MTGPDPRRVVQLWTDPRAPGDRGMTGSGYLIGGRGILTARHVIEPALGAASPAAPAAPTSPIGPAVPTGPATAVPPAAPASPLPPAVPGSGGGRAPGTITFRPLDAPAARLGWHRARLVWESADLDLALLEAGIDALPDAVPEAVWGRLHGSDFVTCTAVGFPGREFDRARNLRDSDQLDGRIGPMARFRSGLLAVDVHGAGRGDHAAWAGFSGAAVFASDRLVGVLTGLSPHEGYGNGRLVAVPVTTCWSAPGFTAAAGLLGLRGTTALGPALTGAARAGGPTTPDTPPGGGTPTGRSREPDPYRTDLLATVEERWLSGPLTGLLHGPVRLDVHCTARPDLVPEPLAEDDGWPRERLPDPPPLTVEQVFAEHVLRPARKRLLIVGAPGSGKTTLLLRLARRLHDLALYGDHEPVPVPLLLQTWRGNRQSFARWAVGAMDNDYGPLPPELLAGWLRSGAVHLLLDGFDELAPKDRVRCRSALAEFFADPAHIRARLILTSREAEYRDGRPLPFRSAVGVRPLSPDTVLDRLADAPGDYRALREAVATDDTLAELLATPLMLGIAAATLGGTPDADPGAVVDPAADPDPDADPHAGPGAVADPASGTAPGDPPPAAAPGTTHAAPLPPGSPEDRRNHLYRHYLERLVRRPRSGKAGISSSSAERALPAVRRLVLLARVMRSRDETVFFPDWITPDWSSAGYEARPARGPSTRTAAAMLIAPALFALVALPLFAGAALLTGRPPLYLAQLTTAGTVAFALGRGFQEERDRLASRWSWAWADAGRGALQGLGVMLGVCLLCGVTLGTVTDTGLVLYAIAWIGAGTLGITFVALAPGASTSPGVPRLVPMVLLGATVGVLTGGVDSPWGDAYSWEGILAGRNEPGVLESVGHFFSGLPATFFDGANVGLVGGVLGAVAGGWAGGVAFGFAYGLMGAVPGGLVMCLALALVKGASAAGDAPGAPSQALRASGRVAGGQCAAFLAVALAAVGTTARADGPWRDLAALFLVTLLLLIGSGPAGTWLGYWSARWELAARRVLPWRLSRFLTDSSERALLSRSGGGFRFVHVTFRDYVAGLGEHDVSAAGLLGERAAPAWPEDRDETAALPTGTAIGTGTGSAHRTTIRRWWGSSRAAPVARRSARATRRALARLLPALGGGYALAMAYELVIGSDPHDDFASWRVLFVCVPVAGAFELLLRFGPRRVVRLITAVGAGAPAATGRATRFLRDFLVRHPQLRPVLLWTVAGTYAGYFLSRAVAALPGTSATVDITVGWTLTAVTGTATLVYTLFRYGIIR
ncbi:NACHT domain-containing protein [Streptomyces sp. NPDC097619]|uniref:NACHT domain-containing protein n=1 Tax=Streptomyces sp. NPDC097619 TaxID=3157228 RepID=UPI00331AC7D3